MIGYDLIVRNARLRSQEQPVDIGIKDGAITDISSDLRAGGKREIRAQNGLVTESFVNPHLHLDKVFTLQLVEGSAMADYHQSGMGKAMRAIERASGIKHGYEKGWILENVEKSLELAVQFGVTHIRAFADVDSKAQLIGVEALLEARQRFAGQVALQVVAFPQDGLVREPGALELIERAAQIGVDVIGGIPWIEYTEGDAQTHVRELCRVAAEHGLPVSMLVDDAGDPGLRTLEMLAVEAVRMGLVGGAAAHHARAMALYPEPYFQRLIELLKRAEMAIVTDPHTGPLHARVRDLLSAGLTVCLGQDDISDAYYPFGRNNMLEVAFLASHLLWMTELGDMTTLYDMVTNQAALALGLTGHSVRVGAEANLVVLEQGSEWEALRWHSEPRAVVFQGKLIKG